VKREKRIRRQRQRRRFRVRNAVKRNLTHPRLSVFRSLKHIYAQIIDDQQGKTLVAASTLEKELRGQISSGGNCDAARVVGKLIAERALRAEIKQVALDRREYKYHGRIAALADAARDAGLNLGPKKPEPQPKQPKPAAKAPKKAKKQAESKKSESRSQKKPKS
jgi:large subunit ribosomal protein L18